MAPVEGTKYQMSLGSLISLQDKPKEGVLCVVLNRFVHPWTTLDKAVHETNSIQTADNQSDEKNIGLVSKSGHIQLIYAVHHHMPRKADTYRCTVQCVNLHSNLHANLLAVCTYGSRD